ncbi:uncharacterized protein LOC143547287 [Bidens hawaiensis]|uniref:uncharacterized protein LOC143547287 n=1 Tax=Bidens hawaiensis TaxID=980011 RepID=UPI00404A7268
MVSPEPQSATTKSLEPASSPRISFSAEFLNDANFICINPHNKKKDNDKDKDRTKTSDFEFLSSNLTAPATMLSADELFFEGKLLPYKPSQCTEMLAKISLKNDNVNEIIKGKDVTKTEETNRMSWFIEDPSPRPPKCTVLWRELLRLKKQRASSLSPSSSTSSSSSASSFEEDSTKKEKHVKRTKKVLERTRSAGIKIRPMVNVPVVCTQNVRSNSLPPLFSIRKVKLDTR